MRTPLPLWRVLGPDGELPFGLVLLVMVCIAFGAVWVALQLLLVGLALHDLHVLSTVFDEVFLAYLVDRAVP